MKKCAEKKFISTAMRLKMEGHKEGRKETTMKIALSLIKKGLDNILICEATGLTEGEVEKFFYKTYSIM